jgi:hypothetical protein
MLSGRMKKLSNHVEFPIHLNINKFFRPGGQCDAPSGSQGKKTFDSSDSDGDDDTEAKAEKSSERRQNNCSGGKVKASTDIWYELQAVVVHVGTADSGEHWDCHFI